MVLNFSGEYRITCVADEHAAAVGLTDKPCWKIEGPDGLTGIVWTWWRDEQKILRIFLRDSLGLYITKDDPIVFTVVAST